MYEERTDTFTIRDLIMLILIIAFFVFLLMWIFPTKDKLKEEKAKPKTTVVQRDYLFTENIVTLKESAKKYYTKALLPENVGDKTTITLQELIDSEFMSALKDSKGKVCSGKDSHVEVIKTDATYEMKVNLKCSTVENYILIYMGEYENCETTICEKNEEDVKNPIVREVEDVDTSQMPGIVGLINRITNQVIDIACTDCKPPVPIIPTDEGSPPVEPPKIYECEYIKASNPQYTSWGAWSSWIAGDQQETSLRQVRSKTERVSITKTILTGYNVITYKDPNKPIYKQSQIQTGTKKELKCTAYGPSNVCVGYVEVETPVYSTVNVLTGYGTSERKEPVYRYDKVLEDRRFYSYRTRRVASGNKDIKWDVCEGSELLGSGYSKTGSQR